MDTGTASVIVAIATMVNSAIGLITLYMMREVKHATNSLTDRLVATTRSDATQDGITQGKAIEAGRKEGVREGAAGAVTLAAVIAKTPVPVADDRTAVAAERSAAATERVAAAAEESKAK